MQIVTNKRGKKPASFWSEMDLSEHHMGVLKIEQDVSFVDQEIKR